MSNNELTTRELKPLPIAGMSDLVEAGRLLSLCDTLGAGNPSEGFFIATVCQQTGQSYQEWGETYNLIHGRPSMKTDAMLAKFNSFGGKHTIISRTPELVSVELDYNGTTNTFSLSWEEAKAEPFPYRGKESAQLAELEKPFEKRILKDKYKTPRSRMQMMWARLVSDSIRCVCPQANKGTYTKEETEDFIAEKEVNQAPANSAPKVINPGQTQQSVNPEQALNVEIAVHPVTTSTAVEETPFDEVDFTVCPDGVAPLHNGKKWTAIPKKELQVAVKMTNPLITEQHKIEIRKAIDNG